MAKRTSEWTITPITVEHLPTALSPSPSLRNTTVLNVRPERESSAMPDSATLPPSRSAGNSISHTHPLHGFSRSSLASIRGPENVGDGREGGPLKGSESMASLSTTGTLERAHDENSRNRVGSLNVVPGMENAWKTVRRAQAMGLITTMPSSLSSTSTSSPSNSLANSVLSSLAISRNGSVTHSCPRGEDMEVLGAAAEDAIYDDDMGTPKAGSTSRIRGQASPSASPAMRSSPFPGSFARQDRFEPSPRLRSTPFGASYAMDRSSTSCDGGMVASTGWMITVVPPDSLFYALNPETTPTESEIHEPETNGPRRLEDDDSMADGLDKLLSAARLKKWRKGKIMPLVPDLKGMMKTIGREWNLPSEVGMEVFLASERVVGGRRGMDMEQHNEYDGEDSDMEGEMDGMLSEETWRLVWAEYVAEAEAQRTRATGTPVPRTRDVAPVILDATTITARPADSNIETQELKAPDATQSSTAAEASTIPEPPSTGSTFGPTSQPSTGFIRETMAKDGTDDLPPAVHLSDENAFPQQHSTNHVIASQLGTLTPASSQTSFLANSQGNSVKTNALVSTTHDLLSPSPSSVFPGGSTSQQASPLHKTRSNSGFTQRRVLGRIEFDFDSSLGSRGEWYATWLKRKLHARHGWGESHHMGTGPAAKGGMRLLQLRTRASMSAESKASESDAESLDDEAGKAQEEYAPLMDEDEDASRENHGDLSPGSSGTGLADDEPADPEVDHLVSNALTAAFPEGPDDFVRASTTGHRVVSEEPAINATYNWKDIGSQRILDDRVKLEQLGSSSVMELDADADDVGEVRQMLDESGAVDESTELLVPATRGQQLLASPIDLMSPNVDQIPTYPPSILVARTVADAVERPVEVETTVHGLGMGIQMDDGEKRGSALVISSQLDVLERALRDLSPRDIRFSVYPGILPPSMRDDGEMPVPLDRGLAADHRASQRFSDASEESVQEATVSIHSLSESDLPRTADLKTPALDSAPMFGRTPDAHTPALYGKYTPRSAPDGSSPIPLSLETMMRMEYEVQQGIRDASELPKNSPGWKPRRPVRPPSPHLEQYTAPSPHLKLSDTPPPATMTVIDTRNTLGSSPNDPVPERPRIASAGSKGINKLNRLFNRRVSDKTADDTRGEAVQTSGADLAEYGTTAKSPKNHDSFGRRLFKGLHVKSPSIGAHETLSTTIISDPVVVSTTNKQAYQLAQLQEQQASPPAPKTLVPPVPPKPVVVRNTVPSIPSSPSLDTLHTTRYAHPPYGTPTIPTSPSLNTILSSPNSPSLAGGMVRRKPVPRREGDDALPTSQSVHSMTSFVLEDAPKRTKKGG